MIYLLDTNICIAFLEGREPALKNRFASRSAADFALCSVVKAELFYGARKSRKVESNLARLNELFRVFPSLSFDDAAAEHYGAIRTFLEAQGTPIGANDLSIAAITLANDLTLVTRNSGEFMRVPALRVESW